MEIIYDSNFNERDAFYRGCRRKKIKRQLASEGELAKELSCTVQTRASGKADEKNPNPDNYKLVSVEKNSMSDFFREEPVGSHQFKLDLLGYTEAWNKPQKKLAPNDPPAPENTQGVESKLTYQHPKDSSLKIVVTFSQSFNTKNSNDDEYLMGFFVSVETFISGKNVDKAYTHFLIPDFSGVSAPRWKNHSVPAELSFRSKNDKFRSLVALDCRFFGSLHQH